MPGHVAALLHECAYMLPRGKCFPSVPEGRTDPDLLRRGSCNLEGWQRPHRDNPGAGRPTILLGSALSPKATVETLTMRSRSCPSSLSGCRQTLLAALLMSSLNEDSAGAKVRSSFLCWLKYVFPGAETKMHQGRKSQWYNTSYMHAVL